MTDYSFICSGGGMCTNAGSFVIDGALGVIILRAYVVVVHLKAL